MNSNTADGQLVAAGRHILAGSSALTIAFINSTWDLSALLDVVPSLVNTSQQNPLFHLNSSDRQHVQKYRKPLFIAMLSTAVILNDGEEVSGVF